MAPVQVAHSSGRAARAARALPRALHLLVAGTPSRNSSNRKERE